LELTRAILFVKDLRVMRDFYSRTLGLEPILGTEEKGWVELQAGACRVALHAIPAHIADSISISDPPRPREETPFKLAFAVGDVDTERSRLMALGVTMFDTKAWGSCDGIDPEGNVFQITRR
jgi:catechol 2,3-dioxygenase-like lactoylglutathione lyase family enzyme